MLSNVSSLKKIPGFSNAFIDTPKIRTENADLYEIYKYTKEVNEFQVGQMFRTIQGKIFTFSLGGSFRSDLKEKPYLIEKDEFLSLSKEKPHDIFTLKIPDEYLDYFTLTPTKKPFVCEKGTTFDLERYEEYAAEHGTCPCPYNHVIAERSFSVSIELLNQTKVLVESHLNNRVALSGKIDSKLKILLNFREYLKDELHNTQIDKLTKRLINVESEITEIKGFKGHYLKTTVEKYYRHDRTVLTVNASTTFFDALSELGKEGGHHLMIEGAEASFAECLPVFGGVVSIVIATYRSKLLYDKINAENKDDKLDFSLSSWNNGWRHLLPLIGHFGAGIANFFGYGLIKTGVSLGISAGTIGVDVAAAVVDYYNHREISPRNLDEAKRILCVHDEIYEYTSLTKEIIVDRYNSIMKEATDGEFHAYLQSLGATTTNYKEAVKTSKKMIFLDKWPEDVTEAVQSSSITEEVPNNLSNSTTSSRRDIFEIDSLKTPLLQNGSI